MSEQFRCGRRGPWVANSPLAYDQVEKGDHYRSNGTCSYCGSVSQEAFLAFIEAGGEVGPTDKSYKAYLTATDTVQPPGIKFYFQHLDEAGQRKFIELVNAKRVRIGYPGHFYVLPFFCRTAPAAG